MKKIIVTTLFVIAGLGLLNVSLKGDTEKPLPALLITPLTGNVYVFTTYQYYKDIRYPANGLFAVGDSGIVMIDGPWDTLQAQPLLDSIERQFKQQVKICIATHHHDDRTGSFAVLERNGVNTYTSELTYQWCVKKKEQQPTYRFKNDTVFTLGNVRVETFYPGPGHTQDNIVIWFPNEKVLYGGCFVKSTEAPDLGNLNDANTKAWETSAKAVKKKYSDAKWIVPGHQSWKSRKSLNHTLTLIKTYNKKNR